MLFRSETIVFRPLGKDSMLRIVDIMVGEVASRIREQKMSIVVSESAREFLLHEGYKPRFGARPLRRTIQRLVEDRIADMLLDGTASPGVTVSVDGGKEGLTFSMSAGK